MSASGGLLIDTDVLIDYLRGEQEAGDFILGLAEPFSVSVITIAELFAGVREGGERNQLDAFLSAVQVILIDSQIAMDGGLIRRDYGKSHGVGLADALVAATAIAKNLRLVTLNLKHFPMVRDILAPY